MSIRCQQCGEHLGFSSRFCGACGAAIEDANIGRVIAGRYTLQSRLGEGSVGVVYAAEQVALRRKVAIKLLPPGGESDPLLVERFRREGEVLCQLRSAHTVTTYEVDHDVDGSPYIVMELSTGKSLADALAYEGWFEWPRVLRIMAGLCDALAEAHALGIVHRNLRPENILLEERSTNRDFVKVLDFGFAKLSAAELRLSPAGETVGAVEFMSPEQLMSRPLDGRSDLYALGVIGYLLATGQHPFHRSRTYGDLVTAHVQFAPELASAVRHELPSEVDMVFARCLEKDPNRRFPDAAALGALLGVMLAPFGTAAQPHDTLITANGDDDTAIAPLPGSPKAR
jgi:serine/threonine protein kinase